MHGFNQSIQIGKLQFRPDEGDQLDLQPFAIKIIIEIEDVGLQKRIADEADQNQMNVTSSASPPPQDQAQEVTLSQSSQRKSASKTLSQRKRLFVDTAF